MTTDPIPDEIMREARDIAFDFDCDWTADGRRRGDREEQAAIKAIARALLTRDQRAAGKCDAFDAAPSESDFVTGQATAAQQIRAAILTYSEPAHD